MGFLPLSIKIFLAGLGPMLWHWGIGVGLIIILVGLELFSTAIPVIGPWLGQFRKQLLIAAAAIGLLLIGEAIGAHDAATRYKAKEVVITTTVDDAVRKSGTPAARSMRDRWDRDEP